jgi:hypothetical protein
MAQTAYPDHAQPRRTFYAVPAKGSEHGDAGAQERSGIFAQECVRNGKRETRIDPDAGGVATFASDASRLGTAIEVLFAAQILLALEACSGEPADADALSEV